VTAARAQGSGPQTRPDQVLDFDRFDVLTFDCYGTLIDWEAGISSALIAMLGAHDVQATVEDVLARYAGHEAELEAGQYRSYREVLGLAMRAVGAEYAVEPTTDEMATFGGSVGDWPAFPDSAEALRRLHERYRLGVITNCDDDLFAASSRRLGITFDWVITAQLARRYKPNPRGFELAFERIGLPTSRILHVAQSLFHDHVTAKRLGLATVWVNRRQGRAGTGATPPANATPDLVVPDMASLADLASAAPS
jgi:2-haloacid dehalogenase